MRGEAWGKFTYLYCGKEELKTTEIISWGVFYEHKQLSLLEKYFLCKRYNRINDGIFFQFKQLIK